MTGFDNLTVYTDEQAVRDGVLINPAGWGGPVPFHSGVVTRWSGNLHEAMQGYFGSGESHVPPWGVISDVLAELLTLGVTDLAGPGEPTEWTYTTPEIAALDDRPIWLGFNGDGYTAMFPSDR